jgi:hypothetical protein
MVPRSQGSRPEKQDVPRSLFECQDQTCEIGFRTQSDAALVAVPGPPTQIRYQNDTIALGSSRLTLVMTPQEENSRRCRIYPVFEILHPSDQVLAQCTKSFTAQVVRWVHKYGEDFCFSEFFDKQLCVGATQHDGTWAVTFYWKQPINTNGINIEPRDFDKFLYEEMKETKVVTTSESLVPI